MKRILVLVICALVLQTAVFARTQREFVNGGVTPNCASNARRAQRSEKLSLLEFDCGALFGTRVNLDSRSHVSGLTAAESLFVGNFSGAMRSIWITLASGTHRYTLSGAMIANTGVMGNSETLPFSVDAGISNRQPLVSSGYLNIPEPNSATLLGTGLAAVATGVVRRKLFAAQP